VDPTLSHPKRIPPLDGLRGLAILGVLAIHYLAAAPLLPSPLGGPIHALALLGGYGVMLFFVLSGFLITGILLDTRGRPGYFRNFYVRRTLRIFPLYYLALVILFVLLPRLVGASAGFAPVPAGTQVWYWTYLSNVFLGMRGWDAGPPYAPHFWSLAVEEQFYLVWPLLVWWVPRPRLGRLFLGVALGALAWRTAQVLHGDSFVFTELATLSRVDALACGAWIALAVRSPEGRARLTGILPGLVTLGVLAVVVLAWWRQTLMIEDAVVRSLGLSVMSFALGTLVGVGVLCREGGVVYRIMSFAPLRFLGRYSYALYVFHYPVLLALRTAGFTVEATIASSGSRLAGELVFVAVNAGITLALSLVSWHLFEQRMLALAPRLSTGRSGSARPRPVRLDRASRPH
jgi:peptidoglycan/LPS O-acetylase OafA/YrhL